MQFERTLSINEQGTDDKPVVPSTAPPADNSSQEKQGAISGEDKSLQLPKEVIERLKYTVFGFDTFWVLSVENYEQDGVVFKGNVRGRDPAVSYAKMKDRLKVMLPSFSPCNRWSAWGAAEVQVPQHGRMHMLTKAMQHMELHWEHRPVKTLHKHMHLTQSILQ